MFEDWGFSGAWSLVLGISVHKWLDLQRASKGSRSPEIGTSSHSFLVVDNHRLFR
jgi:hypothetical protein